MALSCPVPTHSVYVVISHCRRRCRRHNSSYTEAEWAAIGLALDIRLHRPRRERDRETAEHVRKL